jgi:hypothetical protein
MTSTDPKQPTPMTQEELTKLVAAQAAAMQQMQQQLADMQRSRTKDGSTPFGPYIIPGSMQLPEKANSFSTIRTMTEAIRNEVKQLTEVECVKPEVRRSFRLMLSLLHKTQLSNHTPTSKTKPEVKAEEVKAMDLLVSEMLAKKLLDSVKQESK